MATKSELLAKIAGQAQVLDTRLRETVENINKYDISVMVADNDTASFEAWSIAVVDEGTIGERAYLTSTSDTLDDIKATWDAALRTFLDSKKSSALVRYEIQSSDPDGEYACVRWLECSDGPTPTFRWAQYVVCKPDNVLVMGRLNR